MRWRATTPIAAAVGTDDDPFLHAADTIAAGAGLCDALVVERITTAAPGVVEDLARWGVAFDRSADGRFKLGLEAAHGRHRIVHAGGDGTGREILRALIASVQRTPSITVLEGMDARRLLMDDGRLAGVLALTRSGPLLLPSCGPITGYCFSAESSSSLRRCGSFFSTMSSTVTRTSSSGKIATKA